MRYQFILLLGVTTLLSACADVQGARLPLDGTLAGPCAPSFVRAYWSF